MTEPTPEDATPRAASADAGARAAARELMERFAERSGPFAAADGRRYLWTDAFAVCNWLTLGEVEQARTLVDRVHRTLGRHRPDDPRDGWISGLPEGEGRERPTAGGLRIGKPRPERALDEPYDPQLEWDRDGQYFHYLTRWMRALQRVYRATGEAGYREWAVELARIAFDRFSHGVGPVPDRLYWKMSIDLSRPLVPTMGQHDALDGFVVLSELRRRGTLELAPVLDALEGMLSEGEWATDDPLGAGSILADLYVVSRMVRPAEPRLGDVLVRLLEAGARSARRIAASGALDRPAHLRLPFRELGFAIGLAGAERFLERVAAAGRAPDREPFAVLRNVLPLRSRTVAFWSDPANQQTSSWTEHEDINAVMLATALAPDGYLGDAAG